MIGIERIFVISKKLIPNIFFLRCYEKFASLNIYSLNCMSSPNNSILHGQVVSFHDN